MNGYYAHLIQVRKKSVSDNEKPPRNDENPKSWTLLGCTSEAVVFVSFYFKLFFVLIYVSVKG